MRKKSQKGFGLNTKILAFPLLKTFQNRAERNPGRILQLFNCNDRCFLLLREAPKPKCLPGLVSPIKVWFKRWEKKAKKVRIQDENFGESALENCPKQGWAESLTYFATIQLQWQVFFVIAGGAEAKMSSWFSKPDQSLIQKVRKKSKKGSDSKRKFCCLRC